MFPRALAAPLHRHTREDEYSYVLKAAWVRCWATTSSRPAPANLVFKPRNQWHTFWNAGDEPCRILEIISPAGFEHFFHQLNDVGGALNADPETLAQLNARYGQQMRPDSVPELLERFGLQIGEQLAGGRRPPAR